MIYCKVSMTQNVQVKAFLSDKGEGLLMICIWISIFFSHSWKQLLSTLLKSSYYIKEEEKENEEKEGRNEEEEEEEEELKGMKGKGRM